MHHKQVRSCNRVFHLISNRVLFENVCYTWFENVCFIWFTNVCFTWFENVCFTWLQGARKKRTTRWRERRSPSKKNNGTPSPNVVAKKNNRTPSPRVVASKNKSTPSPNIGAARRGRSSPARTPKNKSNRRRLDPQKSSGLRGRGEAEQVAVFSGRNLSAGIFNKNSKA